MKTMTGLLLGSLLLCIVSCDSVNPTQEKEKTSDFIDNFEKSLAEERDEKVELLALKYGIDKVICSKIIERYVKEREIDILEILFKEEKVKNKKEKKTMKQIIEELAIANNLEKNIIAKVVYDYKILAGIEEAAEARYE